MRRLYIAVDTMDGEIGVMEARCLYGAQRDAYKRRKYNLLVDLIHRMGTPGLDATSILAVHVQRTSGEYYRRHDLMRAARALAATIAEGGEYGAETRAPQPVATQGVAR